MKFSDKIRLIILFIVCLAFVALRFWKLTASCLWFDEIFSVHAAGMNFQNLIWFVAQDLIHPPLFYILLKFWSTLGNETLFWLRLFPVFFSILSLIPLIFLCRTLKLNYTTAAVAVFFLAANGCLIKYAQEVRMYSLFMFFALVSMWLFARFLHLGKNIWILTVLNVLLVYTHYFGWLLVLAEITAILVLQRIKIRQILIMFGILLASFAPWIFAIWKAAEINGNLGQNIGWIAAPDLAALAQFLLDMSEPFYYQQSNVELPSQYIVSVPILLLAATAFVIYLIDWKSESAEERQNLIMLAILTFLPILLAFIASWILPYSVWGTRHLIFVFAPFAILTAIALTKSKVLPLVAIFLGLIFILFGAAFIIQTKRGQPVLFECAWENLARNLDQNKPAKIYVFEDLVAYDMWFALRSAEENFEIVKVNGIADLKEDTAYFLPRGFDKVRKTDENGISGERFYLVFRDSKFSEYHPPLRNLKAKGYKIGAPVTFETPGLKGFLVEVWK
jgi:4-amino-4-deoxy-L-arabinose transferase-like glycosyltransferase